MTCFDCSCAESLSGIVIYQWTPTHSEFLTHFNSWLQVYNPGFIFKYLQNHFGLMIHSLQLEKIFCRSCCLALLALKRPHHEAAAEVICLIRRTVNHLHPRIGNTGPTITTTASCQVLQNICSHEHSLQHSWAPCACLGLLTPGTHPGLFPLC